MNDAIQLPLTGKVSGNPALYDGPWNDWPGEGYIPVTGGKVWYRIVGTGKGTPLLVLHGGPGVPSYYLNPLAALGDDRPVVFYDQLGCGRSDQPADTSLSRIQSPAKPAEGLPVTPRR